MPRKKRSLINNGYLQRLNDAYFSSGLSAINLGKAVGRDRRTIYEYINGSSVPDALTLARLCVALNISADWLLFGKEDK